MLETVAMCFGATAAALFVMIVAKAVSVYFAQKRAARALSVYSGPPPVFPWGNGQERRKHIYRFNDMHWENIEKYCTDGRLCYKMLSPDFFRSHSGGRNELVTADPRLVKHVLSDRFDVWAKSNPGGRFFSSVVTFLGTGIFTIDHGASAEFPPDGGKLWHTQRRTAATIFTRDLFKNYYQQVFLQHTSELLSLLQEKVGPRGQTPVDFQSWMHSLTMDCFGKIAFGTDLGNLSGKDTGFGRAFDGANEMVITCIRYHIKALLLRELLPDAIGGVLQKVLLEWRSPCFRELQSHVTIMRGYIRRLIEQKRHTLQEGAEGSAGSDLLALFMKLNQGDSDALTDAQLEDMVASFIIAGRDTTAVTLTWLFYELGLEHNRHIVRAIQEEVDTVVGSNVPLHDDLADLPHLQGAVWEALRLHPPVAHVNVIAKKDDTLPDGVVVPRGTRVTISNYAMGRSRERYGDDVMEFKPDRWIPFKQPNQFEFPVFKAGRRICLGKDMALFEVRTVAAMILQRFTPEVVDPDAVTYGLKLTVSARNKHKGVDELMLRLIPRE
eukprot:TRINITY_DN50677_c0_g1_i1.p1 TRINITY_DN50677_c0_g1~~TRINITY_DN50677_c0_g1_i1.p1  ORF type:complete len:552 (+),score=227.19 TRINITY_DN50677_c0_g1_i1:62-1717(+)